MWIKFLKKIIRHPTWVMAVGILLTLVFVNQIRVMAFHTEGGLVINNSLENYISRASGVYHFFIESRAKFGNEEVMIVAVEPLPGEGANLAFFTAVRQLSRDIQSQVPGVKQVLDPTATPNLKGACRGKSYFDVPMAGSVCESILDAYPDELACLKAGPPKPVISDGVAPTLDLGLDEAPDMLLAAPKANPGKPGAKPKAAKSPAQPVMCPTEVYHQTPQKLLAQAENQVTRSSLALGKDPFIVGDLVSRDLSLFALVVEFKPETQPANPPVQQAFQRIIQDFRARGYHTVYTGTPYQQYLTSQAMQKDMRHLLPFSFGVMVMVLAFSFRSLRGVLVPVTIVTLGLVWTGGIYLLSGQQLNPVTLVLPPLLMCLSAAYLIYFMAQYNEMAEEGGTHLEIVDKTLDDIALPLNGSALTTVAGFASLMTSPIPAVKTFGLFACVGLLIMIMLTVLFMPSLLILLPRPKIKSHQRKNDHPRMLDVGLARLGAWMANNPLFFLVLWFAFGVFMFVGAFRMKINSNPTVFSKDSQSEQDLAFIQRKLAGTDFLRIVWEAEDPAVLQSGETMHRLEGLEALLEGSGPDSVGQRVAGLKVDKIYTPLPYLRAVYGKTPNWTDAEVAQLFKNLAEVNGPRFLSQDGQWLQMTIRLRTEGTTAFMDLRHYLDDRMPQLLPGLKAHYTGSAILTSEAADSIARSEVSSDALAVVIIFVILSIMFLSVRMGLLALYPNVLAVVVFFGLLGWLQIPLGVTISVIAIIGLGIGVDDSIQFLSRYNKNVKTLRDEPTAAIKTMRQRGRTMVYSISTLIVGVLVFTTSDMETQVLFGWLTAFTLLMSLLTDLTFTPSMVSRTRIITAWDYMSLGLDEAIIAKIPLFRSMTLRETKLASLMGYPVELAAGATLFNQGDKGEELFVVLSGQVQVVLAPTQPGGAEGVLATLGTGAAFGEMGLFRKTVRAATIRAVSPTKLLSLNRAVLFKLQMRYPAIAAKLFDNLARNLVRNITQTETRYLDDLVSAGRLEAVAAGDGGIEHLRAVVDDIIADGLVTRLERQLLERLVYADGEVSKAEQVELERLKAMIETGRLKEDAPFQGMLHHMSLWQKRWMEANFPQKTYAKGQTLWAAGEPGGTMLVVLSGKLGIHAEREGAKVLVDTAPPGETVGETEFLLGQDARNEDVSALEDTRVLVIHAAGFQGMVQSRKWLAAQFAFNLVSLLSNRLEEANLRLVKG